MNGHTLHYESDLESLLKDVKEQHPDLLVIDLLKKADLSAINSLMHVHGHTIIRGEVSLWAIDNDLMKNIILLPSGISNDSIIEKVAHIYESDNILWERPVKVLIIEDNVDIIEMYELAFQSKWYEVTRALDGLTGSDQSGNSQAWCDYSRYNDAEYGWVWSTPSTQKQYLSQISHHHQ
jgi:hypothetical protein